ncbi:crossover junction endodeoxyribonuclease RuvC [Fusobacterium sp.]|uniref:crossover junction endodeoxyribonuclease RuvC n=1 Tax=Fusobacterium sp. TaxID=68766 RepID=UPI0025BF784D|nr:crossover junction endodeoxyribonuclease RuvC [Fusobacterium sp.]
MRVLGIDPGTAIVGFSILDFENSKFKVIDYGCVYTDKDLPMEERLCKIYSELTEIIKKYQPTDMAIEELFYFKNNKTVISVAQARGVIILCGNQNNLKINHYTPLQVKTGITGYGKAEKKQVQLMVQKILSLDEIPKPDDAADALAIAITHINSINSGFFSRGLNDKLSTKNLPKTKISAKEYRELILNGGN